MTNTPIFSSFSGTLFRAIPHTATNSLSGEFARDRGGRWNPSSSFEVLYTFTSMDLARVYVEGQLSVAGLSIEEAEPEALSDLIVLECEMPRLVDAYTDAGLMALGLPATYPIGFTDSWAPTQTIGFSLHSLGTAGLMTRSASTVTWTGPFVNWGEVAIFLDVAPAPTLVDRLTYVDWL